MVVLTLLTIWKVYKRWRKANSMISISPRADGSSGERQAEHTSLDVHPAGLQLGERFSDDARQPLSPSSSSSIV